MEIFMIAEIDGGPAPGLFSLNRGAEAHSEYGRQRTEKLKYFHYLLANGAGTPHITGIEFDLGRSAVSFGVPPFSHG
jgi:hypothetical protein